MSRARSDDDRVLKQGTTGRAEENVSKTIRKRRTGGKFHKIDQDTEASCWRIWINKWPDI